MASVSDVFKQLKQEVRAQAEEPVVMPTPEEYCMLESDTTRRILVPEKYSILGVESDEKVKTIKFAFPLYVDDGRLNLLHYDIRINYMTANPDIENNKDQVRVQDLHGVTGMNEEGVLEEYVVFEWLLSRRVTQYKGTITFIVCAVTSNDDGTITTEWNTTLATSECIEGLEVSLNENEETQARDLLKELLANLNNSKNDAITEITQTKTQVISDIEAEGQTQISAVETKGAKVLESIPDDYTTLENRVDELENRVDELEQNRAYVIVGNGSGEFVTLNDSSELKTRNVKLFGKSVQAETTGAQLFDIMAGKNEDDSQYKFTLNDYAAGKFTVSVENPSGPLPMPNNRLSDWCPTMTAGKTYYLSGNADTTANEDINLSGVSENWSFGTTRQITEEDLQSTVQFGFGTYSNIMIVEGSTEKPYEVYTGGEAATEPTPDYPLPITSAGNYDAEAEKYEIGIGVTGKNLFDASKIPTRIKDGKKIVNNGDGSFTISETAESDSGVSGYSAIYGKAKSILNKNKNLKVVCGSKTRPYFNVLLSQSMKYSEIQITNSFSSKEEKSISSLWDNTEKYDFTMQIANTDETIPGTIKPIVTQSDDEEWVPFQGIQLSTLQLPNQLRGIPVDSGGNYTDAEGQQWLCDYIDRERGKYVQCVQEIVFDGVSGGKKTTNTDPVYYSNANYAYISVTGIKSYSMTFSNSLKYIGADVNLEGILTSTVIAISLLNTRTGIVSTDSEQQRVDKINVVLKQWYDEGNPLAVYYQLANPIETDLTPDQLAALNLSTYQGITNIGTDAMPHAGIDVEYIADTKTYIDNAIAEAIAAIPTE